MWLFVHGFCSGAVRPHFRAEKYCETQSAYDETLRLILSTWQSKCDVCYAYYGTQRTEHISPRWICRGCNAKRNLCYEMNQFCEACASPYLTIRRKLQAMDRARNINTRIKRIHGVYTLLHIHFYHIFKTSGVFMLLTAYRKAHALEEKLKQSQHKKWSVYRMHKFNAALRSYRRLFSAFQARMHCMFMQFFPLDVVRSILSFL